MRVELGPIAPVNAVAWLTWVRDALDEPDPASDRGDDHADDVLAHVRGYLEQCRSRNVAADETLRLNMDIEPDELEYLVHAFHTLDARLLSDLRGDDGQCVPDEGRRFHVVLVRDLLRALEGVDPSRAAFADQLRSSWPSGAEAG